ncbi:MAG TPA: DUF47 family protein, partial [Candidatus Nitrosotenuis sp.]|nr:DUF47 family protein [Candidatus Nitrosotenuis sp.]
RPPQREEPPSVPFKLFPRDVTFFDMFVQQAEIICEMARLFGDLVHNFQDVEARVRQINDVEHRGDEVLHDILLRLDRTFVTPIDREDIHNLSNLMDDIIDFIQGSAARLRLFGIEKPNPALREMADLISQAAEVLLDGLRRLPNFVDISDLRKRMHDLEDAGDEVNRRAVAELFKSVSNVPDVVELIKWKEIIENTEDVLDRFEDVFDVLESVVVKHA